MFTFATLTYELMTVGTALLPSNASVVTFTFSNLTSIVGSFKETLFFFKEKLKIKILTITRAV